jgi:hypothetical protein
MEPILAMHPPRFWAGRQQLRLAALDQLFQIFLVLFFTKDLARLGRNYPELFIRQ